MTFKASRPDPADLLEEARRLCGAMRTSEIEMKQVKAEIDDYNMKMEKLFEPYKKPAEEMNERYEEAKKQYNARREELLDRMMAMWVVMIEDMRE